MAENKNAKPFDFGSALNKAKFTDELTTDRKTGRSREATAFDEPLKKAWDTKKVLAFELPTEAVDEALKEARATARYLGFRLEVGLSDKGNGTTTVELKPLPKRERKAKETASVPAE